MFITFEGIEGVGKTTQLQLMADYLQTKGIAVLKTREPGGTPMGEEIRDILLKHRNEQVSIMTELLLMFAARAQHVETIIKPALKSGKWVLCDRFTDASYAYQGGGRGIAWKTIETLENMVLGNFRPDYTLLFDAPIEVGLKRIQIRTHQDRFEKENIDFFERIRAAYLKRAEEDLERHVIIDGSESIEKVEAAVIKIADKLLAEQQNFHPI